MTTFLSQNNSLAKLPKANEESWKRTNPEIFFLPDDEVLNTQGQSALENKNKLIPCKVSFRDFNTLNSILSQLEKNIGAGGVEALQQELNRIVLIQISHSTADVYISENMKSHVEFMSSPNNSEPISKNSPIATALVSRLKSSSPHKITVSVSSKNNETPLFIVLNNTNPNYCQSYACIHFIFSENTKSDLLFVEGGSSFSMSRHELELHANARVNELWLGNFSSFEKNSTYIERIVNLSDNARFNDAQIFIPNAQIKINSHIHLNGTQAQSESGGVVLASEGKFDYEPIQEHRAKLSKSNLNFKMILNKKARGSFQGLIIAQKSAQKCEAKQENKNILLSKVCRVDSEPRLEILPHDIICKHGSATAEIDSKQLYYLQSRGFNLNESQNLILRSFAQSAFTFLQEDSTLEKIVENCILSHIEKVL